MSSLPTALVAGQLAPLISGDQAIAAAPEGLLEALAEVPDPRDARGIRYGLAPVLALAVCAMLGGARSYAAIAEWAADAPARLRARLGLPGAVPDLATIWRVLTSVDPAAFEAATGAWVRSHLAAWKSRGRRVLAVNGKTVRGARPGGHRPRRAGVPHAAQAIQVTRKTRRPGSRRWRTEVSYAITSLPAGQAKPAQLAQWLREHWKIDKDRSGCTYG